jgi:hypothetical protein
VVEHAPAHHHRADVPEGFLEHLGVAIAFPAGEAVALAPARELEYPLM